MMLVTMSFQTKELFLICSISHIHAQSEGCQFNKLRSNSRSHWVKWALWQCLIMWQ